MDQLIRDALAERGRGAAARFAESMGVTPQTVSKWTKGEVVPDMARWKAIAAYLKLSEADIWEAQGVRPAPANRNGSSELERKLRAELAELRGEVARLAAAVDALAGARGRPRSTSRR